MVKILTGNGEDTYRKWLRYLQEMVKILNILYFLKLLNMIIFKLDPTTDIFFVMACKSDLVINNTEDLIELLMTLELLMILNDFRIIDDTK